MTQTPAKPQNSDQTTFLASEQASNQLLKDQANSAAPVKKKEFLTRSQLDLQKTLLLWGLPLVLAPLATLTFLGYRIVHQKQKESLQTQLNSRLVTVTQAVQDTVDEAVKTTKWIAEDDLVIQAAKQGNLIAKQQKLNQLSESQLEEKFSTSKLIRPNQTWNQYLARVGKIGETAEIFFTNTDGLDVAYSNPTSDFVQQDEIWWQMAKKQGIWVSPMSYDESAATNSFSVSQRINQPNSGEFLGVVKTVFATEKFSQIWQYLNQLPLTETESIQLVDWQKAETVAQLNSTGTNINQVIVGSEQFQKLIKAIGEIATQQPVSDWTTKIKQLTQQYQLSELKNKTWQNAQGNKFLLLSFIYQGREYSISSLPISNILAIVSVDNAEIEAAGNDIVGSFVLLSAMIFIVTSTASWWLARRLSAPLQELVEKAEAFAAGDLNVFAQPQGTRETQTLADSFNKLIKQVRNLLSKQELATQRANVIAEISSARTINQEDLYQTFNQALQKSRPLLGVERLTIHFFNPDGSTY
ncbi:MAG: HAMP domain-containing protein, partial [Cyanobacteria bacterium J083]